MPFLSKRVEHNLEVFLFVMGLGAALVSGVLDRLLAVKALREPLLISGAVLVSGLLFKVLRERLAAGIRALLRAVPLRWFLFGLVVVLGLASSIITAIIASLVLVEVAGILTLNRRAEVSLVVVACFSIGLGAALTPVGEPLSTIAVSKLGQSFWYLVRLIGPYVIPGVAALGVFALLYVGGAAAASSGRPGTASASEVAAGGQGVARATGPGVEGSGLEAPREAESYRGVVVRALKVYLFVMALVLLGEGFKPAIDRFVVGLPAMGLYWLNIVSAVLDNATLTAAEVSVKMTAVQVRAVLMGLLIAGGMLIPGNIPNIVSAGKLNIGSREWGALGVPLGLALMSVYFVILFI